MINVGGENGNNNHEIIEEVFDEENTPIEQNLGKKAIVATEESETEQEKDNPPGFEGEELLRSIGEYPENYHVAAEHKALFETLDNNLVKLGYPLTLRDSGVFTMLGFEYGMERIPYKPSFQQKLHEECIRNDLKSGLSRKDFEKKYEFWKKPLTAVIKGQQLANTPHVEYDEIIHPLKERIEKFDNAETESDKRKVSEEAWNDGVLRGYAKMARKKAYDTEAIKNELRQETNRICNLRKRIRPNKKRLDEEKEKLEKVFEELHFRNIEDIIKNTSDDIARVNEDGERVKGEEEKEALISEQKELESLLQKENRIKELEGEVANYSAKIDKEKHRRYLKNGEKRRSREAIKKLEEDSDNAEEEIRALLVDVSKKNLENGKKHLEKERDVLKGKGEKSVEEGEASLANTEELERRISGINERIMDISDLDESIEEIKKEINDDNLQVSICGAKIENIRNMIEREVKENYDEQKKFLKKELEDIKKKKREFILAISKKTKEEVERTEKSIVGVLFNIHDLENQKENVFINNTGVTVLMEDGSLMMKGVSPLDKRIIDVIGDDKRKECWINAWTNNSQREDDVTRSLLKDEIAENAPAMEDDHDARIKELADLYKIDLPVLFDEKTGKIFDSIQENDVKVLEKLMPIMGDFVRGVSLTQFNEDNSLAKTRLEIVDYLSGSFYTDTMTLVRGDCRLNVREIDKMIKSAGIEKEPRAIARVAAELGISLFNHLSVEERSELDTIVGSNIHISESDFYRVFRKSIPNVTERSKVMKRTVFLWEFNKYLANKPDGVLKGFFDHVKEHRSQS